MKTVESKITPIFLLGPQRSGTTWLANMLCAHPEVACVEADEHRGIHESIYFSHFARAYGDLRDDRNYEWFIRDFMDSDYYRLTDIEEGWLWKVEARTYPSLFRALMNELARRRSCRFWIEKSPHHTLMGGKLAKMFPDARFVCITRNAPDLIRSRIGHKGTSLTYLQRLYLFARSCATHSLYERYLHRFSASCPRAIMTEYETVVRNPENAMQDITQFLSLSYDATMLNLRYTPNTSFLSARERKQALGKFDLFFINAMSVFMKLMPLNWLQALERWTRQRKGVVWPDWCWMSNKNPRGKPSR